MHECSAAVTVDMAAKANDQLRAEEASFLGIDVGDVRPFMQEGKRALVTPCLQSTVANVH